MLFVVKMLLLLLFHSVYFSCLISLARTSSVLLNRNGESEHSCLVLDLGKPCTFFTIDYDNYRFFHRRLLTDWGNSLFAEGFFWSWMDAEYLKCFFYIFWYYSVFLFLLIWSITLIDFLKNLKTILHSWYRRYLVIVYFAILVLTTYS